MFCANNENGNARIISRDRYRFFMILSLMQVLYTGPLLSQGFINNEFMFCLLCSFLLSSLQV
jgi:hypothetical protein